MKKVVVITGASSGIGREIAKLFLEKDYILILSGRNGEGFEYVKNKTDVEVILGDITKKEIREKIKDLVVNKYKSVDIIINNAGITFVQPFEDNTEEELIKLFEISLKTPMLLTHDLYGLMKNNKSGTIVFINSAAGKQGYPNHTMYSAMKFGLNGFSQSLRLEARKHGIRVISIHPGGVKTPMYTNAKIKPDINQYMEPKKVAEIVVYLCETAGLSPDEISISRTQFQL
ncbi:hypothetical protein COY90_01195 [Candidatus Roizmanbacteria bacterium CG_4_10_14_0_8_um_filter_39_9]|uniref:Short-chain dehydrogenase n=1 Tax=Candidatus Roizmanbacteria bacterium CG_4_10_14_0_8_um_filter_39_9 TaxID=1974829 RepID=A0A2M7QDN6_9BACT|nr:MAG: hypothetical protein COY90_01195 [Candidatus Roizmanbacteria bacterium CG_4_10_14_0_8_um_filter_39_9]